MKVILEYEEGRKVVEGILAGMTQGGEVAGFKLGEGMMKMMMGFTIERMAKMAGKMMPPEMVARINVALQKIKK